MQVKWIALVSVFFVFINSALSKLKWGILVTVQVYVLVEANLCRIPLTGLSPPYFLPVPNQDLDFQRTSWSFLCSMIWSHMCLFVLLILVKLLTIIVYTFWSLFLILFIVSWYNNNQNNNVITRSDVMQSKNVYNNPVYF